MSPYGLPWVRPIFDVHDPRRELLAVPDDLGYD